MLLLYTLLSYPPYCVLMIQPYYRYVCHLLCYLLYVISVLSLLLRYLCVLSHLLHYLLCVLSLCYICVISPTVLSLCYICVISVISMLSLRYICVISVLSMLSHLLYLLSCIFYKYHHSLLVAHFIQCVSEYRIAV